MTTQVAAPERARSGQRLETRHIVTGLAAAMALILVADACWRAPFYQGLIVEDGVIEYASFGCWLLAAASMMRKGAIPASGGGRMLGVGLLLLFLACAGEEISWGQRLGHFQSGAVMHALNKQDEINLHDIGSISVWSNAFFALTTAFFLLPLRRHRPAWSAMVHPDATRVYLIGLAAWIIVGLRFGTLGFSPLSVWGYYSQSDDELWEFFAAFSFFAFALLRPAMASGEGRD